MPIIMAFKRLSKENPENLRPIWATESSAILKILILWGTVALAFNPSQVGVCEYEAS